MVAGVFLDSGAMGHQRQAKFVVDQPADPVQQSEAEPDALWSLTAGFHGTVVASICEVPARHPFGRTERLQSPGGHCEEKQSWFGGTLWSVFPDAAAGSTAAGILDTREHGDPNPCRKCLAVRSIPLMDYLAGMVYSQRSSSATCLLQLRHNRRLSG